MAYDLDPQTGLPTTKKPTTAYGGNAFNLSDLGYFSGGGGLDPGALGTIGGGLANAPGAAGAVGALKPPTLNSPFNFLNALKSDPVYQQFVTDSQAQGVTDQATRDATVRRGVIQFGAAPDVNAIPDSIRAQFGDIGSIIDPQTVALANANTTSGNSILARVKELRDRSQQDLGRQRDASALQVTNNLAARGLTNSGEQIYQNQLLADQYGTAEQRLGEDYNHSLFDSSQQLLDYLAGANAAYLAAERQRQEQLRQAAEDAANRQTTLYGYTYPDGTPADAPPQTTQQLPGATGGASGGQTAPPGGVSMTPAVLDYGNYLGVNTPTGGPTLGTPAKPKLNLNRRYSGGRIG